MKIAILHYHLNRGGVSRVIQNHIDSILATQSNEVTVNAIAILYGGRKATWPDSLTTDEQGFDLNNTVPGPPIRLHEVVIPELDYDQAQPVPPSRDITFATETLTHQIESALIRIGFEPSETLLHVHNPNLGKNAALPIAIATLAKRFHRILIQVHDFAEDFRPANYRHIQQHTCAGDLDRVPDTIFPQASNIHYAVLNHRDFTVLKIAGISVDQLHLLPNPVLEEISPGSMFDPDQVKDFARRTLGIARKHQLLVYPVRAIGRKNLGEALLWSTLQSDRIHIGITLAPMNPTELSRYEHWKSTAKELDLPIRFELAKSDLDFSQILAAADAILTTSVAEGFGMVYLEPWLAGRTLLGRNLPEITADFREDGIEYPWLYQSLLVPVDWIDIARFREKWLAATKQTQIAFGRTIDEIYNKNEFQRLLTEGLLDFALLDVESQTQIIRKLVAKTQAVELLLDINPIIRLSIASLEKDNSKLIARNAGLVSEHYSTRAIGSRLRSIYHQLLASNADGIVSVLPHGQQILNQVLTPARMQLVRVS